MASTSILPLQLGQAILGRALEPDAPAPEYLRIDGECWKLVTDPAAIQAAQDALEAREKANEAFAMAQYAPRIANRPPAAADAEGKAPGAGWLEYDPATQLLKQMWRWTGQDWEELPMDPVMIPIIQIGTGTAGDLTADRLIVTNEFVARVAQILELSVENLVVTEGATINELVALSIASATAEFQTAYIQNIRSNGAIIDTAVIDELFVNMFQAHSISAENVSGGSFAGQTFTGGAYYGGRFATSNEPFTDGGVQMDAAYGLRGWAPGSRWQDPTFRMSPADGSLHLAANSYFTNPSSGDGLIISPSTSRGNAALFFGRNQSVDADQAAVYRIAYSTGRDQLMLRGGNGGGITALGLNHYLAGRTEIGGALQATAVHSLGDISAQGVLTVAGNTSYQGSMYYYGAGTSSRSANLTMATDGGRIDVSTSSRRYKRNIVDWSPSPAQVLSMRPRQWQHDDPSSGVDETWYVGFVAEEIAELGLKGLVSYAGDGEGGWRPETLNYDRFAAAHQVVLQKHEREIQDLRTEIDKLREQVRNAR